MAGIPVSVDDYRALARHRLPRFLFDYLDGGAGAEQTLAANAAAWARLALRQRVLVDVAEVDTACSLFGEACAQPLVLAPVGLAGLMARRGEVQAVRAANAAGVPFTLSTVGLCGLDEVAAAARAPFWFQLYWLRDRGLVQALLAQAQTAGCRTLVFTVDLPLPGLRHRDTRNGLGVPGLRVRRQKAAQVVARPGWIWRVALRGRPLRLGSLEAHAPAARDLDAFRAFIDAQFDPRVTWADLAWLRERWPGRLVLKGILDADDARAAVAAGADGIVVSNHGGRQLDGAPASAASLPRIVDAVGADTTVLVDGGIRSGVDVFRALALGARGVMIGRPWIFALAAAGEAGLADLLARWRQELHTTMALAGVNRLDAIGPQHLVRD
ncbi:MAG: L-lactate dehydrogenase [Lysobacterales bacterium]